MNPQARQGRWAVFATVAFFLLGLGAAIVVLRKPLAGFAAQAYLGRLGVPAAITVTRLDFSGLSAGVRLGAPDAVLTAERIDLDLARLGLRPEIASLRIVRPTARLAYTQDGLALGPLQRLLDRFSQDSAGPPSPPIPMVVEDAAVTLDTAAGSLVLRGNAMFLGAALKNMDVTANDAALRVGAVAGRVRELRLRVAETQAGLAVSAQARGDASLDTVEGPVAAQGLSVVLDAPVVRLTQATDLLRVEADGPKLSATADTVQVFADKLQSLRLAANAAQVALARDPQAVSLSGALAMELAMDGGAAAGVVMRKTTANLEGAARFGSARDFTLTAAAKMDGGLTPARIQSLLTPLAALPAADRKALAGMLGAMTLEVPALKLSGKDAAFSATLEQPVTVTGAPDARAVISVPDGGVLLAVEEGAARGALRIAVAGGRLPAAELTLSSYMFAVEPSLAVSADLDLSLRGDIAALKGVALTTGGQLRVQGEDISYAPRACARLAIADVTGDEGAIVRDVAASLCPREGKDIVRRTDGAWHVSGAWSGAGARVPAAQVRVADAAGALDVSIDADGKLRGDVALSDVLLSDAEDDPRFASVRISGGAQLRADKWDATLALASSDRRHAFGTAALAHAPATRRGEARFDLQHITFTPDGLQPADLAPQMAAFESATGGLDFSGRFAWGGDSIVSDGTLALRDLGFTGPAGAISGIRGMVRFDSLLPLSSPPGQKLEISRIDWMMPITDVALDFSFDAAKLQVAAAAAKMADGAVSVDPFVVDLSAEPSLGSTLRLEGIDLGPVVASTNFADRVQLAVKVQGAVPFSIAPSGVQFQKGQLHSTGPGRLSIARALWSGPDQAPINAVQDFAYQAMESLAVDDLTGEINSLDGDRLGLVLRVKGRHDPVRPEPTQLGLISLLKGEAFATPVPLPAKTPVDLTLDMSLNFGELLRAYGEAFAQLRNSVQ